MAHNSDPPSPAVYGTSAAARAAGLAENTVRRLADSGVVECARDSANRRVFTAQAVEALRERAQASTSRR